MKSFMLPIAVTAFLISLWIVERVRNDRATAPATLPNAVSPR